MMLVCLVHSIGKVNENIDLAEYVSSLGLTVLDHFENEHWLQCVCQNDDGELSIFACDIEHKDAVIFYLKDKGEQLLDEISILINGIVNTLLWLGRRWPEGMEAEIAYAFNIAASHISDNPLDPYWLEPNVN